MKELQPGYEITRKDIAKDKLLKIGAWSLPFILSIIPGLISFIFFLLTTETTTAAVWLFLTIASFIGGFVVGLGISGGLMFYRSRWLADVRERLAVDGIKAEEVEWFKHELTAAEKRSLQEVEARNLLLGDAFRDSLAARLTATRIQKSAKQELSLIKRQQNKLKYAKTENSATFQEELGKDFEKLTTIQKEAESMRVEAENRMHQIEKAARHGTNFSETDLALKKLSARTAELPLALESARMEEEIRKELEKDS
ncbi:MAG TPA: hypothetical protein VNB22_03595 [Pyrinomonadaceae bacterium]|jgi:hypothetical protein|nr:hypothetical protein [Pyrinomonadaceae bacterium]